MACHNTLTDDQLEAMFTGTDEEIRQTEQTTKCLIERTKHKCKRCTKIFSNKAALKQHHSEPPIKKEKCPYCSKAINRSNNLGKHLKCFEKAPTHPAKRQFRQTTLDGPASSENVPSTPKELIVEEMQVWGGGGGGGCTCWTRWALEGT